MENYAFFDLHTDILTSDFNLKRSIRKICNNEKLGYKSINAIYKGELSLDDAIKIGKAANKNSIKIAFEDCSYMDFKNASLGENFSAVKLDYLAQVLMDFKPLYVSLCWNNENAFASGCKATGGLKSAGKRLIQRLNSKNAVIDTAHANEQSFFEIVKNAKNIICTHTAFKSVYFHVRNLTDEQIKLVIDRNGIIGLVAVGHFLTDEKGDRKAYENAFYEHIDWFLQKFGSKNLCISTDFYGSDAPVFENGDYSFVNRVIRFLQSIGATDSEIKGILYKNAETYFNRTKT